MASLAIEGTDLEISTYTIPSSGSLLIRINKNGICVADFCLRNAMAEFSVDDLIEIGALMPPAMRDLKAISSLRWPAAPP